MKTAFALVAATSLLCSLGCALKDRKDGDGEGLGSSEAALSADNGTSQDAEDAMEDAIENGLGGGSPSEQGAAAEGDIAAVDEVVRENPGRYFTPSGCIVSTRLDAGRWQHVFSGCKGPSGRFQYDGTVTSTWTSTDGVLQVVHEASGFVAKGANVTVTATGARTVRYAREGGLLTKERTGSWSGEVVAGSATVPWTHTANFVSTWDGTSKCFTRDGQADNSVDGRAFGRTVTGFRVCGGVFSCPLAGELEIRRKDGEVTITVTFEGGQSMEITGPRGNTVKGTLVCTP